MKTRVQLALALTVVALLALPAVAFASPAAQDIPGESNLGFLMAALIIVWAGFFAYVFYISRKTNELRREIDDLRDQLNAKSNQE
jgi:CcmD family protein